MSELHGDNHLEETPLIELDEEDEAPPPDEDKLDRIVRLARLQMSQDRLVKRLEAALESAKRDLGQTAEVDLPNALLDAGIDGLPLANGWRVEVDRRTFASIPKGREKDALEHLREVGGDPIIKYGLAVELPKGNKKLVDALRAYMRRRSIFFKVKETVHPQSLSKFVRDKDKEGAALKDDLLGVHRTRVAKLVAPKEETF